MKILRTVVQIVRFGFRGFRGCEVLEIHTLWICNVKPSLWKKDFTLVPINLYFLNQRYMYLYLSGELLQLPVCT